MGGRKDGTLELRVTGRYVQLLKGELKVEDLDEEELARCQLKDRNGKFTGRPPKYLPRSIVMAMKKEFLERGDQLFSESYVDAVKTFGRIMRDPRVDPAVQLKAAQYVVERIAGKTPERIELTTDAPWQVMLEKIIVRHNDLDNVIEAEVVDEETAQPQQKLDDAV